MFGANSSEGPRWVMYENAYHYRSFGTHQALLFKEHAVSANKCVRDNRYTKSEITYYQHHYNTMMLVQNKCRPQINSATNNVTFDPNCPGYTETEGVSEEDPFVHEDPNCSNPWLLEATECIKSGDINKARLLLQKGIREIDFREMEEKLKMWQNLMYIEAHFGNNGDLLAMFQKALKYNDKRSIYIHMLILLIGTEKKEELEIYKKHILVTLQSDKEMYLILIEYYMKQGEKQEGRRLFKISLRYVPREERKEIQEKFAELEHRYGDTGRSGN